MDDRQNVERKRPGVSRMVRGIGIAMIPLLIAGLYIMGVIIHGAFRYDNTFFTPEYQDQYFSPGSVAVDLEHALRTGDSELYAQLTGLRSSPIASEEKPDIVLSILIDVDDRDYFHYMYFDLGTYLRETHYIKEVKGRWIVSPQDAYFYYDSGQWMKVFAPITAVWWAILIVVALISYVSKRTAQMRTSMGYS